MRALLLVSLLAASASAQEGMSECAQRARQGMPEGPALAGLSTADFATGRRVCARTEIALGGKFGAIIDTPDFYGDLAASGILAGSVALKPDLELFATLEAVSFRYTVNAVLSTTQLRLGHLTAGLSKQVLEQHHFVGAITGRVLFPTSFATANARTAGAEVGFNGSWQAKNWLEVHGFLATDVTFALSNAAALPTAGFSILAGLQWIPLPWLSAVVDLNARLSDVTFLAPSIALRARVARFGIELGGTLPVVGTDRHDFLAALRVSYRFDDR
jgi:hypothetical protein